MNLAFTTIALFLIFAPGILFRYSYYSYPLSKKYSKSSLVDEIALAIIPGLLIQIIGYFLVKYFTSYEIDISQLGKLLLGTKTDDQTKSVFDSIQANLKEIFYYNLLLNILSFKLGDWLKRGTKVLRLDKKVAAFRFSNEWYYIMSGEILDFPFIEGDSTNIDFVVADILVTDGKETIIYSGVLVEYYLN